MSKQLEMFAIPSPCRGMCQVNARGYCVGCARSRDERFHWQSFDDAQKREVWRLCKERFARARRKKASSTDDTMVYPVQLGMLTDDPET